MLITVMAVLKGRQIDPEKINPYRRRRAKPERKKSPEQIERESKLAWEFLDQAMLQFGGK